ncbi:MAG: pyridoxal-phosphate dependent enzyme [Candidatus Eisenbacteria bacterium]|nr:pyridoxal-phosphate dependent enzyme [Candidatus Eisenbacteria bacterium]
MKEPTIREIREAQDRIRPHTHRTPLLTCAALDREGGARFYFKCENFQKVGAFKARGATNAVFLLGAEEATRGVATHSSGNHAAALALAARSRGVPAYVVMPRTSPRVKVEAVRGYGAEIVFCEPNLEARERGLAEVVARTGAAFIHPYDDPRVIAGQGTAAAEMIEDGPEPMDAVIAPVGGGGLLSGTALAFAALSPRTAVIGAEPKGADDAYRSLREGKILPSVEPRTVADGLLTSLGRHTFPILRRLVREIVTVEEETILRAMRLVWTRMKIVIEPSAAVAFAAALERPDLFVARSVGVIFSGGNVDPDRLPEMGFGGAD